MLGDAVLQYNHSPLRQNAYHISCMVIISVWFAIVHAVGSPYSIHFQITPALLTKHKVKYIIHKNSIEKTDLNVSNLYTAFLFIKTTQGSYVTCYSKYHILVAFLYAILIYGLTIPGFSKMRSSFPAG